MRMWDADIRTKLLQLLNSLPNLLEHCGHGEVCIAAASHDWLEDGIEEVLSCVLGAVDLYRGDCYRQRLVG